MSTILTVTMNPSLDIATRIDHVQDTIKLRCASEESHAGGGGINVARLIHNLGGDTTAIFPCGGYTGDQLLQLLREENLPTYTFPIIGHTRQSFSIHETSTGKDYRFLLPGHTLDHVVAQQCLDYIRNLHEIPSYIIASGSLPPGVADTFYVDMLRLAQSIGSLFVLDTSGPALSKTLDAGGVYFCKPSLEELEELTGNALPTQALQVNAARALIEAGKTKIIVVSLGARGALLITAEICLRASGLDVQPVSSVGAGDSMVGGIVWALGQGQSLDQTLQMGVASATATILNKHGEMGHIETVERLIQQVQITHL